MPDTFRASSQVRAEWEVFTTAAQTLTAVHMTLVPGTSGWRLSSQRRSRCWACMPINWATCHHMPRTYVAGNFLVFGRKFTSGSKNEAGVISAFSNTGLTIIPSTSYPYCAGHTLLADGRAASFGGTGVRQGGMVLLTPGTAVADHERCTVASLPCERARLHALCAHMHACAN